MANVVESLFGNIAQATMANPVAAASQPADPLQSFVGLGRGVGESLRQNITSAFGQMTPQQALSNIVQQTQQQADLGTPEGLVQLANNLNQLPQFSGLALAMRQEASNLAQKSRLTGAKIFQAEAAGAASLASAMREKEPKEPTKVGVSEDGQNVFLKGGRQFTIDPQGNYIPFSGKIREGAGTKVELSMPQEAALIEKGLSATADITKRMKSLNTALNLNSQNSPFAGEAFKQEVGTVFGDNVKAAAEIRALANTGALDTRIANRIVSFFEGKVTQTTKEDRDAVLKSLQAQSEDDYERTVRPFRAAIKDEKQAMRLFPSFKERYSLSKGIIKQGRPIPAGQESKYTEGSKWEKGGKKYIVRNGQLIEE